MAAVLCTNRFFIRYGFASYWYFSKIIRMPIGCLLVKQYSAEHTTDLIDWIYIPQPLVSSEYSTKEVTGAGLLLCAVNQHIYMPCIPIHEPLQRRHHTTRHTLHRGHIILLTSLSGQVDVESHTQPLHTDPFKLWISSSVVFKLQNCLTQHIHS